MPYLPTLDPRQVGTPISTPPPSLGPTVIVTVTVSPDVPTATSPASGCSPIPTSSALPRHSKAGSNTYTDIVAGSIVGAIGFILILICLFARGIPWLRAYPARIAAIKVRRAEVLARDESDDEEENRGRGCTCADTLSAPDILLPDISRIWIPPNLGRNHVPTPEGLAMGHLTPTIRIVQPSASNSSLQAGIDAVQYDRELRLGEWGVDQELPGNPTYLRIPPRRSSLGFDLAEHTLLMTSSECFLQVSYKDKGKRRLTDV